MKENKSAANLCTQRRVNSEIKIVSDFARQAKFELGGRRKWNLQKARKSNGDDERNILTGSYSKAAGNYLKAVRTHHTR